MLMKNIERNGCEGIEKPESLTGEFSFGTESFEGEKPRGDLCLLGKDPDIDLPQTGYRPFQAL